MAVLSETKSALLSILFEDDQCKKQEKDRDPFQHFAWEFPEEILICIWMLLGNYDPSPFKKKKWNMNVAWIVRCVKLGEAQLNFFIITIWSCPNTDLDFDSYPKKTAISEVQLRTQS